MNLSLARLHKSISNRLLRARYRAQGKNIVHLIHIGKTAGTAIKDALSPARVSEHQILEFHSHETRMRDIRKGDRFMFFVRDPISRFTSGFYSRQRQGQPRIFSPWTADEEKAFTRFKSANCLANALSSENVEERAAAEDAMRSIRHVRDSYWSWFGDEQALLARKDDIFFIGAQETLAADFERLRVKLRLPESIALPTDPVKAHRNPKSADYALDERAKENLHRWYAREWEFLEFCKRLGVQ